MAEPDDQPGDGYGGWTHPDPAKVCPIAPRGHRAHADAVSCEIDSQLTALQRRRTAVLTRQQQGDIPSA